MEPHVPFSETRRPGGVARIMGPSYHAPACPGRMLAALGVHLTRQKYGTIVQI